MIVAIQPKAVFRLSGYPKSSDCRSNQANQRDYCNRYLRPVAGRKEPPGCAGEQNYMVESSTVQRVNSRIYSRHSTGVCLRVF